MEKSRIEGKIRHARIAAMVCGFITLASSVAVIRTAAEGQLSLWGYLLALADVIFIFGMAYGMSRKSRMSSVLMFLYFLLSKVVILSISNTFHIATFIIGSVFLYFFIQGIIGTFAYHTYVATREETEQETPFGWVLACSGGFIIYIVVFIGFLVEQGYAFN